MTNIWLSAATWTVILLGFVLYCAHPDFRTIQYTKTRIMMWIVLAAIYMGCSGLMILLHIPVSLAAAVLILLWAIWRRASGKEVLIEGMFRALIWIGVVMTMEICIMYYRLGFDTFFVPDFDDPVLTLPIAYVVLIGFVQLILRQITLLRSETDEAILLGYRMVLLAELPVVIAQIILVHDVRFHKEDARFTVVMTAAFYLFNVVPVVVGFFERRNRQRAKNEQIYLNQYEYYLQMEQEHRQVRRIYHDLKSQIMMIREHGENMPEAFKNQVESSENEILNMERFAHTGQRELNILLFNCRKRAQNAGIRFDVTIAENSLNFIEPADLNTIFINAFNNAFEACEKIPEEERFIEIKAGTHLDDVLILFRNSASPERQIGNLRTSKEDKLLHGLGLPSIRRIAKKYNGYLDIRETDENFRMTILFVNMANPDDKDRMPGPAGIKEAEHDAER